MQDGETTLRLDSLTLLFGEIWVYLPNTISFVVSCNPYCCKTVNHWKAASLQKWEKARHKNKPRSQIIKQSAKDIGQAVKRDC